MIWHDLLLRLRALAHHRRAESELDEELRFHLEMEARKKQAAGMGEAEARRAARAGFGGLDRAAEECRDVRGLTALENLARDIRYGVRVLRKTPVFTAVAILSLAIGIGANTAIFSLVDAVMLRILPVRNPEQLVILKWGGAKNASIGSSASTNGLDPRGGWTTDVFSWLAFAEMRAHTRTLAGLAGFSPVGDLNVAANGQALSTGGLLVSGNYFSDLGVPVLLGRPLRDDDDTAGGVPAVVISYRFWERVYGLDAGALGKSISVNGQLATIVGITARQYYGISSGGFAFAPEVDLTLPIRAKARFQGTVTAGHGHDDDWFANEIHWIQAIGRLVPPHTEAAVKSEMAAVVNANLPEVHQRELAPEGPRIIAEAGSRGLSRLREAVRKPLLVLLAVVGLTLLMACANLAGMLLARAVSRQKEIMVRLALGAARPRLVRQLLIEGALLSAGGAAAGMAVAWWGVRLLKAFASSASVPIAVEVRPDMSVLGFTMLVAVATTLLFALAPALRATRVDVAHGLKQDTPAIAGARFGAVRLLLAVQIAAALVLVAGATLFARTLANFRSLPVGFNAQHVVVFDVAPGKNGYDEARGNRFYTALRDRLCQVPGVTGVTLSTTRLLAGWQSNGPIYLEESGRRVPAKFNFVGSDFFPVMRIPVVLGRGIEKRDLGAPQRVAVLSEGLARKCFGQGSPIGKRFRWYRTGADTVEVIGVAKDALYDKLTSEAPDTVYGPYTQTPWNWPQQLSYQVRVAGSTSPAVAGIRRAVAEVDRTLPLINVKTIEDHIDDLLARERLFAWLVSLFAAITVGLACIGIYGLVACSVASRTREIGVRMALGAGRPAVTAMILRQVVYTAGAGLAVGIPTALVLSRFIESQLFGVKARDTLSIAIASVAVIVLALAAAALPARRAMRIDPVRALRYE